MKFNDAYKNYLFYKIYLNCKDYLLILISFIKIYVFIYNFIKLNY